MAGLRDQLLKSGLVDEKKAKKIQREKQKEQKQQRGMKGGAEEDRLGLQKARSEKAERDRQLNQQRQAEMHQKSLLAQVQQLITVHALELSGGDIPFSFTDQGKVKRLYITEAIRGQLARGQVGIVGKDSIYSIVPRETAEKIAARDGAMLLLLNELPSKQEEETDEDDPYAEFQVPDDLVW